MKVPLTFVDSLKAFLKTNSFDFYAVHQMFKSHIPLQLWMTFPSTVCTFECNLSLILCVIVLPCTLSFSSLCYCALCPFPPCSTVHLALFLVGLPCILSFSSLFDHALCPFPRWSTMQYIPFLTMVPPWSLSFSLSFLTSSFLSSFSSVTCGRNPWVCFSGAHQQHSKMIC